MPFSDDPPHGVFSGAENHLEMLMKSQLDRGCDVELLALIARPGPRLEAEFARLRSKGIRMTAFHLWLPDFWMPSQLLVLAWAWKLKPTFRERRNRVIHTHLYYGTLIGTLAASFAGCRHLVDSIHDEDPTFSQLPRRWYFRYLQKRAAAIIAISERVRDYLIRDVGVSPDKVTRVYYGLEPRTDFPARNELRERFGIPREAFVAGFIGRLAEQKNVPMLIAATGAAPFVQTVIVGGGTLEQFLREQAAAVAPGRVHFLGIVPDAAALMPMFDVFCLVSLWEALGLVLLEAMQCGVPIIATRVGAVAEVLASGAYGLLIPSNDPAALARALQTVKDDPGAATGRARGAREFLQKQFTIDAMARETFRVYERVLSPR
jgi:glycosyltransferase involved in cell wall biosynthesis